jgi:hypothetical protein
VQIYLEANLAINAQSLALFLEFRLKKAHFAFPGHAKAGGTPALSGAKPRKMNF